MPEKDKMDQGEKVLLRERGKRGVFRIVFGRTTVIILLLLLQLVLLFALFRYLNSYMPLTFAATVGLSLVMALVVVNQEGDPTIKISWLVIMMVAPVFGGLLYIFVGTQITHKIIAAIDQRLAAETAALLQPDPAAMEALERRDPQTASFARYMAAHAQAPAYTGCEVTYFPQGEDKFRELLRQLEQAERFIFMEYFILAEGYMWRQILEVLERKAREGVEVRVMYDGTCAVLLLPYQYPKTLEELGIQCRMFNPLRVALSTHYNNRDHRKIVVIDGHTAFTGGINLADEYIGRKVLHGHWKDTAVMIRGPAVRSFTLLFLHMWNMTPGKMEDFTPYLPQAESRGEGTGWVIPYGDSPLDGENVGETVYMDILNTAQRYVHIMTPYLILDNEMVTALTYAAKRGVEVVILMPHVPDKRTVFALSRNYYSELLKAGVRIYEYTPGFLHAKVFVSDDRKAVVGSINLDYRSLYLHFECAAFLCEIPAISQIEADYQATLAVSQEVTLADCRRYPLLQRLTGKLLRLAAPLL